MALCKRYALIARSNLIWFFAVLALVLASNGSVAFGAGSPWQDAYKVRMRLIAAAAPRNETVPRYAFVELELAPGWKTYWRNPGEAGGIPPDFEWKGSENLVRADVLFPAPKRLADPIGDAVGYQDRVIFPVRLKARDDNKPIALQLVLKFGICKEICVPTEANLKLDVPVTFEQSIAPDFIQAIKRVPRIQDRMQPGDPLLQSVTPALRQGENREIAFTTKHIKGVTGADLFLEAPPGLFVPTPKRTDEAQLPKASFRIQLSESEYQDLKDQTLKATVVDERGASEAEFVLR